jgi:eukaryotic-like serine/threonine-protein kinase
VTDSLTALRGVLADRYAIERELGRGGMATVYLAQDRRHDRPVALKVLHPDLAAALGPERFQREIRLAARLQHPHILSVHDSGEAAGFLWFTMPFVEGESLRSKLDREHQLALEEAVRIAREAADALEYAHQHGIVHRDIKPENILLSSGHALVADFGVARALSENQAGLTGTGLIVGTPAYMSPEQASGERQLDGRTDVYALGCVLYEMLAGEPPFTGPTAQAVISRALTDTAKPLRGTRQTIPSALDMVVAKAMAKLPADRFASAAEFARALVAAAPEGRLTEETVPAGATAARRRRVPLTAVLGLGFLIGVGALFAWRATLGGAPSDGGAKVIAVLPFENQGAAEDEYFADGLTDEIRGKLAGITGLQVIASGSADQYKKTDKPPSQIAQELGARYLLTGRVRWEKGGQSRVRVSPELILISGNRTPTTVWQQPFDASLTDVFQVQADIASRVAQALDVALGANERREIGERPTANLAAYDAYLKAEETNAVAGGDPVDLRRAIQFYEQAVALDSTFALAYARLAQTQTLLYANSVPDPRLAGAALQSAQRAVSLAPDRPEPANALGRYYGIVNDEGRAQEIFAAALRTWPNDADLLAGIATSEMSVGRWEDALRHFGQALRVDPRSVDNARRYARALLFLRRYDEALPAADRAIALSPSATQLYQTKAMIFLARGDLGGAQRVIRQIPPDVEPTTRVAYMGNYWDLFWVLEDADQQLLLRLTPSAFDENRASWAIVLAQTYALRGDRLRARAYADTARVGFERLVAENPGDAQMRAFVGLSNAYLGRKQEAIEAGERAVELVSMEEDGFVGPYYAHLLARSYTMVGEHDKAVAMLERLLQVPYFLSPGWLRIDPAFEPLRTHPRFRELVKG